MSDGITDSSRDSEMRMAAKKLGGSAYCDKCGKYHPVLPFCPEAKIPKKIKKICQTCLHQDKSSLAEVCLDCHNKSNWREEKNVTNRDVERKQEDEWFLEQLKINHSDATKRMFTEFTLMYNEIESMGIDPKQLGRVWNPARTG